jgi:hypothetical protein
VDVAAVGNEIRVAAGTYTDIHDCPRNDITTTGTVKAVVCVSKTVTIRGGYNTSFDVWDPAVNVTTLNAQNLGRGIYITGDISPTIESLSITGGDATGLTGYDYYGQYDVGGGVYVMTAAAILNNNRIFNNTAQDGGGVYLGDSNSQLNSNTISNNHVTTGGGGVFLYHGSAALTGNTINSNTSNNMGGGLYLFSTDATLRGNTITGNATSLHGGGVDVASCSPAISGNIISGNTTAFRGGGLVLWYSHSILTNNVITDNQSSIAGSGLWIGGSQPQLLHTTIARNTGGDGSGVFVTDDGSGTNSTVTMTNTVLASQTVGVTAGAGSVAAVDGVLWFGNGANTGGAGSIPISHASTGDPAFAPDGYHLTAGSAAIDQGVSAGVTTDMDGQPRLGVPDLGADEYWATGFPKYIYLPLIMRNQ